MLCLFRGYSSRLAARTVNWICIFLFLTPRISPASSLIRPIPLRPLRLLNPKHQLLRTHPPLLQPLQPFLHTAQPARQNLIRHRLEPSLLQPPREEPEHHICKFLVPQPSPRLLLVGEPIRPPVRSTYISNSLRNRRRDLLVVAIGKDKRDMAGLTVEDLADILEGVMLADAVERVGDFAARGFVVHGRREVFHELLVADAVV